MKLTLEITSEASSKASNWLFLQSRAQLQDSNGFLSTELAISPSFASSVFVLYLNQSWGDFCLLERFYSSGRCISFRFDE